MHRIAIVAIALVAIAGARAEAKPLDVRDLYRKAEALVQSLLKPAPADHEVIEAPGDIDRKMALAPPAGGTMRLIEPSMPFRQR